MIVILWIILAVLVGYFASTRGRSGIGFFLLAVLISPLITFIVVLLIKSNKEEKLIANGTHKKCPACAEIVKSEATTCKHCQHRFDAEAMAS